MLPLLFSALALAAPCDQDAALATLRGGEGEAREAYLCLASLDRAGRVLVDAIDAAAAAPAAAPAAPTSVAPGEMTEVATAVERSDPMARARLTRALALWFLARPDATWEPLDVARLGAADRRLVGDGIHARRGRASPVAEHVAVFEQLGWYKPNPRYSDNLLTTVDQENLRVVEHPPPLPVAAPPPPEAPPEKAARAGGPPPPDKAGESAGCGCSSPVGGAPVGGAPVGGGLAAAMAALVGWRRRRPGAAHRPEIRG